MNAAKTERGGYGVRKFPRGRPPMLKLYSFGPMANSLKPMMAVYRQEGDGRSYRVVRNVYLPIAFGGRRWGDLELAYSFD